MDLCQKNKINSTLFENWFRFLQPAIDWANNNVGNIKCTLQIDWLIELMQLSSAARTQNKMPQKKKRWKIRLANHLLIAWTLERQRRIEALSEWFFVRLCARNSNKKSTHTRRSCVVGIHIGDKYTNTVLSKRLLRLFCFVLLKNNKPQMKIANGFFFYFVFLHGVCSTRLDSAVLAAVCMSCRIVYRTRMCIEKANKVIR